MALGAPMGMTDKYNQTLCLTTAEQDPTSARTVLIAPKEPRDSVIMQDTDWDNETIQVTDWVSKTTKDDGWSTKSFRSDTPATQRTREAPAFIETLVRRSAYLCFAVIWIGYDTIASLEMKKFRNTLHSPQLVQSDLRKRLGLGDEILPFLKLAQLSNLRWENDATGLCSEKHPDGHVREETQHQNRTEKKLESPHKQYCKYRNDGEERYH